MQVWPRPLCARFLVGPCTHSLSHTHHYTHNHTHTSHTHTPDTHTLTITHTHHQTHSPSHTPHIIHTHTSLTDTHTPSHTWNAQQGASRDMVTGPEDVTMTCSMTFLSPQRYCPSCCGGHGCPRFEEGEEGAIPLTRKGQRVCGAEGTGSAPGEVGDSAHCCGDGLRCLETRQRDGRW